MTKKKKKKEEVVTLADLPLLKRKYKDALYKGDSVFMMKLKTTGTEAKFLVAYAKYAIEYLEMIKKNSKKK